MTRLITIVLILWTTNTLACSCNFYGDFLETISDKENELVIGQILGQNRDFFQVRIDTVINGTLSSDTINLMSGNGANCWEIVMENDIGKSFIFDLTNLSHDSVQYYGLSECGTPKLELIKNKLQGRISGGTFQNQELDLSDFLELYTGKRPQKDYGIYDLTLNDTVRLNGNWQRVGEWKIAGYVGLIIEEGNYSYNGKKNGKWKYYLIKENKVNGRYQRETAIKKIVLYDDGHLLEVSEYFDNDGNKLNPGSLKNGKGQLLEYYNSGELYGKYIYNNGVKDGEAEEYKKDYKIKGNFKNGKREGIWETYENNTLVLKEIYVDGKKKEEIWIE